MSKMRAQRPKLGRFGPVSLRIDYPVSLFPHDSEIESGFLNISRVSLGFCSPAMAKPGRGRRSPPSGSASASSSRSRSYSGSDSRSSSRSRSPSRSRSFSSSSSQSRSVSSRSRSVSPKRKRFFLPHSCICLCVAEIRNFLLPSVWLRGNRRLNSWK